MVHQNRTVSKAMPAKHLSPLRNMDANKMGISASPADSFLHKNPCHIVPAASSGSTSGASSNRGAYYYNNMITNNREQFNALHFC